jgi:hypothetical protein
MRWFVFFVVAYVLLAMQVGLAEGVSLDTSWGPVQPWFVLPLAVFVGLSAPPAVSLVAFGVLGLLLDLTTTWPNGATFIGPYTLGYIAGHYVVAMTRGMLVKRHPLAMAFTCLIAGFGVQLVAVGVFAVRNLYDPIPGWVGSQQLVVRSIGLLYTAAIAAVVAIPLNAMATVFGFRNEKGPMPYGRRRSDW